MAGPWVGGLSNIVLTMNTVLQLALLGGASFRFPSAYPSMPTARRPNEKDWMKENDFLELFGKEPQCPSREVPTFVAACSDSGGGCPVEGMPVTMDVARWPQSASTLCGCQRVLVVNDKGIFGSGSFNGTNSFLRERYWKARAAVSPGPLVASGTGAALPPVSGGVNGSNATGAIVTVHVRLGELEQCSAGGPELPSVCQKKLSTNTYRLVLDALLRVLPPKCSHVNVVTDGTLQSPDVVFVKQRLEEARVRGLRILTAEQLSVRNSFDLMTAQSDVLVYGASGFGQLAALLARPEAARVGTPMPPLSPEHPMAFLANTTQLVKNDTVLSAALRIAKNQAVLNLIAQCMRTIR